MRSSRSTEPDVPRRVDHWGHDDRFLSDTHVEEPRKPRSRRNKSDDDKWLHDRYVADEQKQNRPEPSDENIGSRESGVGSWKQERFEENEEKRAEALGKLLERARPLLTKQRSRDSSGGSRDGGGSGRWKHDRYEENKENSGNSTEEEPTSSHRGPYVRQTSCEETGRWKHDRYEENEKGNPLVDDWRSGGGAGRRTFTKQRSYEETKLWRRDGYVGHEKRNPPTAAVVVVDESSSQRDESSRVEPSRKRDEGLTVVRRTSKQTSYEETPTFGNSPHIEKPDIHTDSKPVPVSRKQTSYEGRVPNVNGLTVIRQPPRSKQTSNKDVCDAASNLCIGQQPGSGRKEREEETNRKNAELNNNQVTKHTKTSVSGSDIAMILKKINNNILH